MILPPVQKIQQYKKEIFILKMVLPVNVDEYASFYRFFTKKSNQHLVNVIFISLKHSDLFVLYPRIVLSRAIPT